MELKLIICLIQAWKLFLFLQASHLFAPLRKILLTSIQLVFQLAIVFYHPAKYHQEKEGSSMRVVEPKHYFPWEAGNKPQPAKN